MGKSETDWAFCISIIRRSRTIPFEEENDAKKFLKERKGKKILRIMDISLKLIMSLDNP